MTIDAIDTVARARAGLVLAARRESAADLDLALGQYLAALSAFLTDMAATRPTRNEGTPT